MATITYTPTHSPLTVLFSSRRFLVSLMPKSGLKSREVSSDHFSSGVKKEDEIKSTRCVIHLLEAKDLLASDIETGKSDPICFIAISQQNSRPNWEDKNYAENGILFSDVKNMTVNPKWNSIHTFPLVIESVNELLKASILFLFKDEDIQEDGSRTYDNLGEVSHSRYSSQREFFSLRIL
jgi:hypothetical protein